MRPIAVSPIVLLIAAPSLAATSAVSPYGTARVCPETPMSLARKQAEKPQLRRLDMLPPASVFLAVDRRVSGCPAPLMLKGYRR